MQEITAYNKANLRSFIDSEEFRTTEIMPISYQRALSYLSNPRAGDDDYFMYVAREDQKIVAYRIVLPDYLFISGEPQKIAWFSCIYVAPDQRGSGIAKKLTAMAMNDWGDHIIYNDPVTASGQLYSSTGKFKLFPGQEGIKTYLRFNFRTIGQARGVSKPMDVVLRMADALLNGINNWRLSGWKRKMAISAEGKVEYLHSIDQNVAQWIEKWQQGEFIRRNVKELNWILKHPWIIENEEDEYGARYHFSAFEKEFRYDVIKLLNERREICGLIMLSLKNGQMKIPYCYLDDDGKAMLPGVLYHHMLKTGAGTLTVFNREVVSCILDQRHPFWMVRKIVRPLFVAKKLMDDMLKANKHFQDGDGDYVFT